MAKANEPEKMIYAILMMHGINDYGIWYPDLSIEDDLAIQKILSKYDTSGYSARGTLNDIRKEVI